MDTAWHIVKLVFEIPVMAALVVIGLCIWALFVLVLWVGITAARRILKNKPAAEEPKQ